ncbi:hypothetical protein GGI07_005912, partial [Coemansia sp. Benny D115]
MTTDEIRRPPFDGYNQSYRLWALRMKGLLRSKSCISAIEEDCNKPPVGATAESIAHAVNLNGIAVMLILDSLDDVLAEKHVIPFDGHNMSFDALKFKVLNTLESKGVIDMVESDPRQDDGKGNRLIPKAIHKPNGVAKGIIQQFISDELLLKVHKESAYEMWSILVGMFEIKTTNTVITELRRLMTLGQDSEKNPVNY